MPVLDSIHAKGLVDKIVKQGIPRNNLVVWEKNGIEHYYPERVLDQIFGEGGELEISGDTVSKNGVSYKKFDLAGKVTALLTKHTAHPSEVNEKLLPKIRAMVGESQ